MKLLARPVLGLACMRLFVAGVIILVNPPSVQAEKWSGVDETVVERFAGEAGQAPHSTLWGLDQGDLPLFFFLLAGAVGGFVAGYQFRSLFPPISSKNQDHARP